MASFETAQGNEGIKEGASERSVKERLTTVLAQEDLLNAVSMNLINYERESSQKLRNRIKALSETLNRDLLDSISPFLLEIEQELARTEATCARFASDIRTSAEEISQLQEMMRLKPENLPALEELGILQRWEKKLSRNLETFTATRWAVEDYFKNTDARVSSYETFVSNHVAIPERDISSKLEDLMKFKPSFENN